MMVALSCPIYAGHPDEIPVGTLVRVQQICRDADGLICGLHIARPGGDEWISVSVYEVWLPDPLCFSELNGLITRNLALIDAAREMPQLATVIARRRKRVWLQVGHKQVGAYGSELVVYAGGGQ